MDWWHKSVYEQAVGLASDPLEFVGEPQSLLINGRGMFGCFPAAPGGACNASCALPALFTAVPGKTYRVRTRRSTSRSRATR